MQLSRLAAVASGALSLIGPLAVGLVVVPKSTRLRGWSTVAPRTSKGSIATMSTGALRLQSESESWAEEQRSRLEQFLKRIDGLQSEIQAWNSTDVDNNTLQAKQSAVEDLEKEIETQLSAAIPPVGLSMTEFKAAIKLFFYLTPPVRLALVRALGMEDEIAKMPFQIPQIVRRLYEEQYTLTPQLLKDTLKAVLAAPTTSNAASRLEAKDQDLESLFSSLADDRDPKERDIATSVNQFLPRVTRKEGQRPSLDDVKILTNALGNSKLYAGSSPPIEIPGGYIIRGENRMASGSKLISALDEKLPADWDCTVSYMYDVSEVDDENLFEKDFALVLLKNDFSPVTSDWLYRAVSLASFGIILLFSIGVYGANQDVLNRLTDASSLGDFSSLDWFNGKILQVLGPILIILASHEFGHILTAKNSKIETTSLIPTFLPIFGSLPLLGTLTRIKSSPKDLTSLFDFAFLGPLLGFLSSFIFLGSGLVATKAALDGGASAQFLPSLPVSVLGLSTLGGSIIDNFFAGGDGYITALDPATPVPLHPFAIAGYCGLLINGAEMLPLGATDGGRLALTIFGRRGHSIIGGLTWFALLVASFTLEDRQTPLLITAWATNNIFQNDMEVPCRDESENPNLPRMAAAFSLWFLAALTIIPISTTQ